MDLSDRPAALVARAVTLDWPDGTPALKDVDLQIARGEHVAIVGASGAGKSSLLAVLAGALAATGTVERHGRVVRIRQGLDLVGRRSALTNVLAGALTRGGLGLRFSAEDRARAKALLARVGLSEHATARVDRLSGGEAQRVAIARALMAEPDILLADEPVASLDPMTARQVMALLDELRRERGLTLVSVLHDHALAHATSDRVVTMDAGRIVTGPGAEAPPPPRLASPRQGLPPIVLPIALAALTIWAAGVVAPDLARLEGGLGGALETTGAFLVQLWPAADEWATVEWGALWASLVETLRMAVLGTGLAVLVALPLAAVAARNIAPRWLGAPVRGLLNVWRAVPSIIWALLFVAAVGLGAMAGVFGLAAYSVGYLTKLFYEALEGVDNGAPSALAEMGASTIARFIHAVLPAAAPALAGAMLFMLEYNIRAASVLGLVGAGGIGHELKLAVDWSNWHVVGVVLAMLAATVLVADALSAWLRRRLS